MKRARGALRFAERQGGRLLREEGVKRIPRLVELPKLLSAAEHVMEEKDTDGEEQPFAQPHPCSRRRAERSDL